MWPETLRLLAHGVAPTAVQCHVGRIMQLFHPGKHIDGRNFAHVLTRLDYSCATQEVEAPPLSYEVACLVVTQSRTIPAHTLQGKL